MSSFKAKMHQIWFQPGLCPVSNSKTLQCSPRSFSWIWESLLL